MPTAAHVVFIPGVLLIGIVLGFLLGGRAARDEAAGRAAREARREERRQERTQERQKRPERVRRDSLPRARVLGLARLSQDTRFSATSMRK